MILASIVLLVLAAATDAPATRPASAPASLPAGAISDRQLDRLVADLNSPRFVVRESATRELCDLDAAVLPKLAQCYRAAVGEEARHRLRYAMETIFYQRELAGRNGFIGIRLSQQTITDMIDPSDGRKCHGIYILDAIKDMPAAKAGIQSGDTIIGLNDRPLPAEPTSQQFISLIERTPPGSTIRIRVLRPEKRIRKITVQPAKDEVSTTGGLKLSSPPPGLITGGIRVVEAEKGSTAEAAGLKANDLISAANGVSVAGLLDGLTILTQSLQSAGPAAGVQLSVQSCEDITLEVVVGRRTPQYVTNTRDRQEMQARFARWWRQQGGQWHALPEPPRRVIPLAPLDTSLLQQERGADIR
ncbi:MAG: PDZ domain-containing protein [Phycisphaerae bacterium]